MADKKKPAQDAIKRHKPQQSLEMRTPGGAQMRLNESRASFSKDYQKSNSDFAARYAKMDKSPVATKENVREGTKGLLSKQFKAKDGPGHER